jgi:glyoxylase-like metal-dependent hydrolase (beta-lactamase superfamily II)
MTDFPASKAGLFRIAALAAALAAAGLAHAAQAQPKPAISAAQPVDQVNPQPHPPFVAVKVTDDMWEVPGAGSNVTILVTDEGLVLVDSKYEYHYDDLMKVIREKVSTKPVRYVIDTHYHADHSGGNTRFLPAGATVISSIKGHDNIVNKIQPGAPPNELPANVAFTGEMRLYVGGKEVRINSYGPGHTGTDVTVFFPQDRVICVGDLAHIGDLDRGGQYPLIDYNGGGGINGWIQRLDTISAGEGYDKVIPGHGAIGTKADIIAYRDLLEHLRDHVSAYLRDGTKTEADLRAHLVKDEHWPDPGLSIVRSTHGMYMDLKP